MGGGDGQARDVLLGLWESAQSPPGSSLALPPGWPTGEVLIRFLTDETSSGNRPPLELRPFCSLALRCESCECLLCSHPPHTGTQLMVWWFCRQGMTYFNLPSLCRSIAYRVSISRRPHAWSRSWQPCQRLRPQTSTLPCCQMCTACQLGSWRARPWRRSPQHASRSCYVRSLNGVGSSPSSTVSTSAANALADKAAPPVVPPHAHAFFLAGSISIGILPRQVSCIVSK